VNHSTTAKTLREAGAKPKARCKSAGGATLGRGRSREAQRQAALILEVLAGMRTPAQAAEAMAVSVPRYYQLEGRALGGLVSACEPCPKGRARSPDHELAVLKRQHERLQRELIRQQTLVRIAQRNFDLMPPAPKNGGQKRRRRPAVRALGAAAHLQEQSQQAPTVERREQTA
jgi:hypothetical protein